MRKILMEHPDFNTKIIIELEEQNKELCDEVWNELPFTTIDEHGVVSGELTYSWVPLLSVAPVKYTQLHSKSPIGRVSYSQGTGNKIIVKYGECNEDLAAPVLGYIPQEYHEDLARIGREIWVNYFLDKKIYKIHFSKVE